MKHLPVSVALLCVVVSLTSCSKSGVTSNPVNPGDTTHIIINPPNTAVYTYTYDSSFVTTGSFATMGAIQPDGKIIIANTTQIARLNNNGSLDNSFATGNASNGEFHCLALQKDGKILIGGSFKTFNGQNKAYYLRLNNDGTVDNSFTVLPLDYARFNSVDIRSIAVQSDNKILLGGNLFYIVSENNGLLTGPQYMLRLNTNGSYDASFKHNIRAEYINCIRVLADGKILFTGQSVNDRIPATETTPDKNFNNIVKLNTDGSIDSSFKWSAPNFDMELPYTYLHTYGQAIAVQDDGKILLGGRFEKTSSVLADNYRGLVRLKADGSLDNTFTKWTFDAIVPSLCMASDKLIIGTMHDPDRVNYTTANSAVFMANKDGTMNANFKFNNFLDYGDNYLVLEDANKNLVLFGKFYDRLVGVYSYHGVLRLKRL